MKAAVWHGVKDIRVEEVELRALREEEVKVKVAWAGICGSDLHEYEEGPVFVPVDEKADLTGEVAPPLTMGHEFAGIIEEVGSKVTDFKAGDRVVINPTLTYRKNMKKSIVMMDLTSLAYMETVDLRNMLMSL